MSSSNESTPAPAPAAQPEDNELVHTEATATMLTFANPPENDPQTVGSSCSNEGFSAIGIRIVSGGDIIDFSLIDPGMCADLASAIELCVDSKGFFIPALTGTMQVLNQKSVQITFANFGKAIAQLIKPKGSVL
ncbi:MAG: hypothetical protein QOJ98_83 [Acidobacteriota bacterium]|jgi:hypothetical protein|nr:hypothetical protein [Acidobacteriota bacterium]